MHAAPPVRVSLGRSPAWIALTALCFGAAAANAAAWLVAQASGEYHALLVAAIGMAAAFLSAWWAWRSQVPGDLNWDGTQWQWRGVDGAAHVALDLDAWMLLRWDVRGGGRRWIAASRRSSAGPWPALRAALYAPSRLDPPDAPREPPAA